VCKLLSDEQGAVWNGIANIQICNSFALF